MTKRTYVGWFIAGCFTRARQLGCGLADVPEVKEAFLIGITPHAGPSTNWYATLAESAPDAAAALVVARRTYATPPSSLRS